MILLLKIIYYSSELFVYVLILRAVLSWFPVARNNYFFYLTYRITEPILYKIRDIIPSIGVGVDISPIIAILLVKIVIQQFLINILVKLFI